MRSMARTKSHRRMAKLVDGPLNPTLVKEYKALVQLELALRKAEKLLVLDKENVARKQGKRQSLCSGIAAHE